jgi:hypothetical protein
VFRPSELFLKTIYETFLNTLLGKLFSSIPCVPASLASNCPAFGAQAGEEKIAVVVKVSGFMHFRRATQAPLNLVYEAKA